MHTCVQNYDMKEDFNSRFIVEEFLEMFKDNPSIRWKTIKKK